MSTPINVSEFTLHMLTNKVTHLEQYVARLQQAIMENAYVAQGDNKVMCGWARQALGQDLADTIDPAPKQSAFFDTW
jgi:hypothetical protein